MILDDVLKIVDDLGWCVRGFNAFDDGLDDLCIVACGTGKQCRNDHIYSIWYL